MNSNDLNPLGPKAQMTRKRSYQLNKKGIASTNYGFWIRFENTEYQYRNGSIYIAQENDFIKKDISQSKKQLRLAVRALIKLETESSYARKIIHSLQNSKNKFVLALVNITESYTLLPLANNRMGFLNNNAYAFQILEKGSLMVDYAPFDKIGSGAEIRWMPDHGVMSLAHELSHAFDANYGLLDDRLMYAYNEVMSAREIRALFHENTIRHEMNKKMRIDAKTGRAFLWDGKPYTYPLPVSARY